MDTNTGAETPIARIWRGATRWEDRDAYLHYLQQSGIHEYRTTPGNQGVLVLTRRVDSRAEFLLLTLWESEDAIRRFAGDDIGRAVFYPRDDEFLVQRELTVDHYEVLCDEGFEP